MTYRAWLAFSCAVMSATAVRAEEVAPEKFWLQAGVYIPKIDTSVSAQATTSLIPATTIAFERDLGFRDRAALPSVELGMRLDRDWRLVGEFYRLSRSREAALSRAITFDGVTYPINASVRGSFSSDVYRLTLGYSFVKTPTIEAGASIGAHLTDFSVGLAGSGSVGTAAASFQERRRRVFAPLPTIGAHTDWRVAPKVKLSGELDFLSLKVGDYNGRLVNAQAGAAYEVARGLNLGVMWRHVDYRLRITKTDWSGQVDYGFSGPLLFAEYRFGG
jgi:hypothetical protein